MSIQQFMEQVERKLGLRFACELHAALIEGRMEEARPKVRIALKAIA